MKKVGFLGIILALFAVGFLLFRDTSKESSLPPQPTPEVKEQVQVEASEKKTSLFVPYWTLGTKKITGDFDELIYFGITPTENGIDRKESGYVKLSSFIALSDPTKKKLLTVRVIDPAITSKLMDDSALQKKVIEQSVDIMKQYAFDGIVLDFELSSLAFASIEAKINKLYKNFYQEVKKDNSYFAITLFGDTFYRGRPYDVSNLAQSADEILVMAYDFHKSRGNPGPNFPLHGRDMYGYDFTNLIEDFMKNVPKDKLSIVFGAFGYDWKIDGHNQSIGTAEPLSLKDIQVKFLDTCTFKNCIASFDSQSEERNIFYTDEKSINHIVWFEDEKSIEEKKKFLKEKGIQSTSMWAYSYF